MDELPDKQERLAPIGRSERLVSLDWLRGLAVLGILLANINGFSQVDTAYYWPDALPGGAKASDKLAWVVQFVLVDGKFRGIFSILFGAGMVLFIDKVEGYQKAMNLQARRLGWLALFGLAHFFLLFKGDILFSYACAGLFALFAIPMKARTLVSAGILWGLAGALLQSFAYLPAALAEAGSDVLLTGPLDGEFYAEFWQGRLAEAAEGGALMTGGSYWEILAYRIENESDALISYATFGFYETIPLMMIGMGFYKSGVFAAQEDAPHWLGLARFAFLLGLALNLAIGLAVYWQDFPPYLTQLSFFGLSQFANVPMLAGGVALLAHYASQPRRGWLDERMIAAGRMAFSNYIGTSLVMVLIFQGWAGGLFGTMHRLESLLVVALGWALMLLWSKPWLARYRHGPLEWLWRCLTYWRIFPFKR